MDRLTRNTLGHFEDCPYWDWGDFSKCKCAEFLAGIPEPANAVVVAPMPLRDYFASQVNVPWQEAFNMAMACRSELDLGGKCSFQEIISARVQLRYLEADGMIAFRALPKDDPEETLDETEPSE